MIREVVPVDKTSFPRRLTEERNRRGYTQRQVAEALGVSDKTYSKWETGVNEMTVDTLCRLAQIYGCSPAAFFSEEEPEISALRRELKSLRPEEAFLRVREMIDEAFEDLSDVGAWLTRRRRGEAGDRPLSPLTPPEAERDGLICMGDGFLLKHWGADADLRLLLMPAADGNAWLKEEAAALSDLFRTLSRGELMALLLLSPPDSRFTPEYLSRETGLDAEQVRESMELFCRLKLSTRSRIRTADGDPETYTRPNARLLLAVMTLAHRLLTRGEGTVYNV